MGGRACSSFSGSHAPPVAESAGGGGGAARWWRSAATTARSRRSSHGDGGKPGLPARDSTRSTPRPPSSSAALSFPSPSSRASWPRSLLPPLPAAAASTQPGSGSRPRRKRAESSHSAAAAEDDDDSSRNSSDDGTGAGAGLQMARAISPARAATRACPPDAQDIMLELCAAKHGTRRNAGPSPPTPRHSSPRWPAVDHGWPNRRGTHREGQKTAESPLIARRGRTAVLTEIAMQFIKRTPTTFSKSRTGLTSQLQFSILPRAPGRSQEVTVKSRCSRSLSR